MADPAQRREHYRPYSSSCPRCGDALTLAAVRRGASWYCSPACAEGTPARTPTPAVAAPRLTNRPRRFHGRRRPKELRTAPNEGS